MPAVSKQPWWHWLAAILITALGWAMAWLATVVFQFLPHYNYPFSNGGAEIYIIYGLVGITFTLLGLRTVGIRLGIINITILYIVWGMSSLLLAIFLASNVWHSIQEFIASIAIIGIIFGATMAIVLRRKFPSMSNIHVIMVILGWIAGMAIYMLTFAQPADHHASEAVLWLATSTPLGTFIGGIIGGGAMFWQISHISYQTRTGKAHRK